ncbi:MAG: hypothetical protein Kow0068_03390 [Marinilabiliales bacterium]
MKKLSLVLIIIVSFTINIFAQPAPGCPYVDAGPDQVLDCVPCTDLTATFHETGLTDSYVVSSIPYNPPFPYSGGTQIPITSDDDWSNVINIPFDFCFYNQMYNQLIIGDNGVISFDLTDAGGYCPWSFTNGIPYDYGSVMNIFGAYHDTYLPAGGTMWYSLEGTYPCRMFVFKFDNVAQYSCNSLTTTQQIILYETTNVIEVYIDSKPVCSGWNSGNAVVGIQDMGPTQAVAAPGRNSGAWVGSQEAWRFTPDGAPNYTVNWYDDTGALIGTGATVHVCPNVTTTYTAEVVYSHCNGTSTVVVTDDVTVSVINSIQVDAGTDQNICPGGSANIGGNPTANGGNPPYTYNWSSNPTGFTSTSANPTVSPNVTTTYTVTVTDAGGCSVTDSVIIVVSSPTIDSYTTTPDSCGQSNGTMSIIASGGYGAPYTFDIPSGNNTTGNFTGLAAGPYDVTVTDSGGCTYNETININTTGNISAGFTASPDQCLNGNSFDFTNTGDTGGGITWSWSFAGGNPATSTDENPTGITFSTPGTHTVTQTATLGACNDVYSYDITVFEHPTVNVTVTDVTCNGACDGTATAVVNGGTPNYTYIWDDTASQTTSTANNLCAGNINVTVTDANGCTNTSGSSITENSAIIINSEATTDVSCYGNSDGSVTVTASGGCAPLTYAISSTLTNANGNFIQLSGGTYNVTITDCNGCTVVSNPLTVNEPPAISIDNYVVNNITCYGYQDGNFTITASGGTSPLSYSIDGSVFQPTSYFNNLNAGNYTCIIQDANGCTNSQSFTITEPQEIVISSTPDQTICNGQSATITTSVAGGTAPYTYHWSTGASQYSSIVVSPTTQTEYTVSVTDANGCESNSVSTIIYVSPPVDLTLSASSSLICPGEQVLITVNPYSGYGPPYTVYVDGMLTNIPFYVYPMDTTTYNIMVEDICGSTASDEITINVAPLPYVGFQPDTTSGCQPFTVNFNTIYPAESYIWNFGDNDNNNLSYDANPTHVYEDAGTYTVTLQVVSEYGCKNSQTIADLIHVYELPEAKFIPEPDVVSIIKPYIHFQNYSYLADTCYWYFGDGDSSNAYHPDHTYPIYPTGNYNVELVVASENGCRDTVYKTIIVKDEYTFYAPTSFTPDNDGINDYFFVFGNGIDKNTFHLYIYDRWGEIIFDTQDINEGWDGRINGTNKVAPVGTYTWLVTYKDLQNIQHEEAGAVTIIR